MREKFEINIDNLVVKPVEISEIRVKDRLRVEMGEIEELAQSMTKEGLLQPIGVYPIDPPEDGFTKELAYGGRRFAAAQLIAKKTGVTKISCRIYTKALDPLQLRLAEFAENFYRKDLTWQEEVKTKEAIHSLQVKIHGVKHSTTQDAPGWSQTDTAKMIGKSKATLSQDLSLADIMKDLPQIDWGKFESKKDAQKAIKKARESIIVTAKADKVANLLGDEDSKLKSIIDSYKVGDFFEVSESFGDATMDLVEIDPPYSIDLEGQKKNYSYSGYNEIDPKEYPDFMRKVFATSFRIMKANSWLICWFGPDPWFDQIYNWLIEAGFKTKRLVGIWAKGKEMEDGSVPFASGQSNSPQYNLANAYEMFYIARKGSPSLAKPGTSNLFGESPVAPGSKTHPTERPIHLMERILTALAQPGSTICVPFVGSGNTLIAAYLNQMLAVGTDLTKEYKDSYIVKANKIFGG